jgi:hypothetical protein
MQRHFELYQDRLLDEYLDSCEDERTQDEIARDEARKEDAEVESHEHTNQTSRR